MLSLSLFYIQSEKGWENFSKKKSRNNSTTEIFVLVTYGTITSQEKNHPRRAYGMFDMLVFWSFLVLFGTLVLKGKTRGDKVTSEKIFSNPHHQIHFLLWDSVIFLNPKWHFLHFQVPCSQILQETPNFIKITKLTWMAFTISICRGVLNLLTSPTPSVLE